MNMMTKAKRWNDRGRGRESEQKRVHRKETAPHPLCVCVCVLFMFMTYSTQTYIKTVVNMLVLCPYDLLQIVFRLIFC